MVKQMRPKQTIGKRLLRNKRTKLTVRRIAIKIFNNRISDHLDKLPRDEQGRLIIQYNK